MNYFIFYFQFNNILIFCLPIILTLHLYFEYFFSDIQNKTLYHTTTLFGGRATFFLVVHFEQIPPKLIYTKTNFLEHFESCTEKIYMQIQFLEKI